MTANVVIGPVFVLFTVYRHCDIQVFKQILLTIFKHSPYMVISSSPRLPSRFVKPDAVLVHTTSAGGGGGNAACTVRLK
jgi:hypothetical protein